MKKRNMLTKVAALSMAGLMTVTGLPVAGLDGALSAEAANIEGTYLDVESTSTTTESRYVGQEFGLGFGEGKTGSIAWNNTNIKVTTGSGVGSAGIATSAYIPTAGATTGATAVAVTPGTTVISYAVATDAIAGTTTNKSLYIAPADLEDTNVLNNLTVKFTWTKSGSNVNNVLDKDASDPDVDFAQAGYKVDFNEMKVGDVDVTGTVKFSVPGATSLGGNSYLLKDAKEYSLTIEPKDANSQVSNSYKKDFTINAADWTDSNTTVTVSGDVLYSVSGNDTQNIANQVTVMYGADPAYREKINSDDYDIDTYGTSESEVPQVNDANNGGTVKVTPKSYTGMEGSVEKQFAVKAKDIDGVVNSFPTKDTQTYGTATTKIVMPDVLAPTGGGALNLTNGELESKAYTGSQITIDDIDIYDSEMVSKDSPLYAAAHVSDNKDDKGTKYRFVKLEKGKDYELSFGKNINNSGKVYVTFKGNYKCAGKVELTFDIVDSDRQITESNTNVTMTFNKKTIANGGEVTYRETSSTAVNPTIEVKFTHESDTKKNFTETVKTTDSTWQPSAKGNFKVKIEDNSDVGTAKITIVGTGYYAGTVTQTISIVPKDISELDDIKGKEVTYNGSEWKNEVGKDNVFASSSLKDNKVSSTAGGTLVEGEDYDLFYDNNVNAGTGTVTIKGKGNYTGVKTVEFTIKPVSIKNASFDDIINQVLGAEGAATPDVSAKYQTDANGKQTLVNGTDYTLSYKDNAAVGTATVTVEGINNFKDKKDLKFKIVGAEYDLAAATITLVQDSYEYDGAPHAAAIKSVVLGEKTLSSSDYKLKKAVSVVEAGTYDVEIVSNSKTYGGTGVAKFTIAAKEATVDFKLSATKKTYNGKAQTVEVKDVTRDGVAITEDEYTISGTTKATDAGKKTVTVTLKGNYAGSAKKTWTIAKAKQTIKVSPASKTFKASKVKKAKQTFTIKVTGAKGTKSFKSNSKKVTVTKAGKVTVKKGTKKGTYKITVKAAATKNYNAAASKTVTIKVK